MASVTALSPSPNILAMPSYWLSGTASRAVAILDLTSEGNSLTRNSKFGSCMPVLPQISGSLLIASSIFDL
ncbi:hypothetical protein BK649_20350 [Pseudomonas canadensis]|uniref:Uncharacterized protein n=1 Tax=Pseudomonas canadensis TaxID=915099 RepID=A0A423F1T3_9PSED|nr:hypothetical protein BK649_20350 [Pseudomonas canadensis]